MELKDVKRCEDWHLICKINNDGHSLYGRNGWTYTNDYELRERSVKSLIVAGPKLQVFQ